MNVLLTLNLKWPCRFFTSFLVTEFTNLAWNHQSVKKIKCVTHCTKMRSRSTWFKSRSWPAHTPGPKNTNIRPSLLWQSNEPNIWVTHNTRSHWLHISARGGRAELCMNQTRSHIQAFQRRLPSEEAEQWIISTPQKNTASNNSNNKDVLEPKDADSEF